MVGVASGIIALTLGALTGVLAAYAGGRFEQFVMRVVDIQLGFPAILVALILLAVLGKGVDKIIIALVCVQWAYYARTARAAALVERGKEYMEAARGLATVPGAHRASGTCCPTALPPLIVVATVQVAHAIALEATLSFLGLGLPPTEPSLGLLIANGFQVLLSGKYWISFYPGIALLVTILSINLVGDQLRDVLNPRLAKVSALLRKCDGPRHRTSSRAGRRGARGGQGFPRRQGGRGAGAGRRVRLGQVGAGLFADGPGRRAGPHRLRPHQVRGTRPGAACPQAELRRLRGKRIAMIFQDPMMTLNPVPAVDTQMVEAVLAHEKVSRSSAVSLSIEMPLKESA